MRWTSHMLVRARFMRDRQLTETIALINHSNLELKLRKIRMVHVRLPGHSRSEALLQIQQVEGGAETGVGATSDEDAHARGRLRYRAHRDWM